MIQSKIHFLDKKSYFATYTMQSLNYKILLFHWLISLDVLLSPHRIWLSIVVAQLLLQCFLYHRTMYFWSCGKQTFIRCFGRLFPPPLFGLANECNWWRWWLHRLKSYCIVVSNTTGFVIILCNNFANNDIHARLCPSLPDQLFVV